MSDKTAFNTSFSCHKIVDGGYAAICDISVAKKIITEVFSKDGTCNYYLTYDRMLASDNVLAIQACNILYPSFSKKQLKRNIFQKQSPYLEDFNKFILLAIQMGVIEKTYYNNLPNATSCNTIRDAFKSHAEKNQELIMELKFIYGMLIVLGIGVNVAMVTFLIEVIWSIIGGKRL